MGMGDSNLASLAFISMKFIKGINMRKNIKTPDLLYPVLKLTGKELLKTNVDVRYTMLKLPA